MKVLIFTKNFFFYFSFTFVDAAGGSQSKCESMQTGWREGGLNANIGTYFLVPSPETTCNNCQILS